MFRRFQALTLVTGLLLVLSTGARAKDQGCTQNSAACCPAPQASDCCPAPAPPQAEADKPAPVCKPAEPCAPREKPYAEAEVQPTRTIAPRVLPPPYSDEIRRAQKAADVVTEAPSGMIGNAKAIAVFPSVKKAAFGFGGRWGRGLLTRRDDCGRWIPPSYVQITGGNLGFQAGIQSTDLVLVFTDEDAIKSLLRGKLTLNADASAAAGPWGRKIQSGVPILLNSGIFAYSRSRGLFAGVSLDGAAITIDDSSNANVYGLYISGDEILRYERVEVNTVVAPFLNALELRAPAAALAQQQQQPQPQLQQASDSSEE